LICHGEQGGVFPLSAQPRECARGSASALAEIQTSFLKSSKSKAGEK